MPVVRNVATALRARHQLNLQIVMNDQAPHAGASFAGILGILVVLVLAFGLYLFFCFCCKRICEKAGHTPGILIWIPIAQLVPLLQVAGMQVWMIILFFVPIANIIVGIMMWAKICAARGKSPWLVILMFIPLVNIVFLPYLAFSE